MESFMTGFGIVTSSIILSVFIIMGCFFIYLIARLITTAILRAKEEFYEQRSKKETGGTCSGNKR